MINYVAHWDRILIQSRSQIVNELSDYRFRSICPVANENELKNHYAESLNWKIAREKYFDFFAVLSLRKILKNIDDGSIFHIFTLKTGFLFMVSNLFLNKKFKSTLSITGLGYFFSKNISAKIFKIILQPVFITLINKTYKNIIYQNSKDKLSFNKYSHYKNNSYLIESSGINTDDYLLKNNLTFYLAGDLDKGNPNSLTQKELEDLKKISSLNYLGYINLQKEIHNYDLLLSLSDHEGFSRVLLEAMYVGLFVVAYENNGTEYINNFENTILLNSKDIKYLENKINEFLNEKISISNQNRKQISKHYSTQYIASQFAKIYNEKSEH